VYSELGTGTTFKVYVPAVARPADRLSVAPGDAVLPRGHETILFVEDDDMVRKLGARILRNLGYRVIEADDGVDALGQLDRGGGRIDLLMTDVVMPGMNGRELARLATARHPGVSVLYASGYTENVVVHHGIVDADVYFIHKPYTPPLLARKVRDVLDGGVAALG